MEQMKAQGIQTSIHYPPVHQFQAYSGIGQPVKDALRVTEEVASREVTLPLYPALTDEQVQIVAQAVQSASKNSSYNNA